MDQYILTSSGPCSKAALPDPVIAIPTRPFHLLPSSSVLHCLPAYLIGVTMASVESRKKTAKVLCLIVTA